MGLCWLASYPKSGSTWLRAMLTVYLDPSRPLDLDRLVGFNDVDRLQRLIDETGIDVALLDDADQAELRAALFRREAAAATSGPRFVKTHLANRHVSATTGQLFDQHCGRAVYVLRHPFDVAVSYSHYVPQPLSRIVELMCSDETVLDRPGTGRPRVLAQPMTSWAGHVNSWVHQPALPVLTIRYEDMMDDAAGALSEAVDFVGLQRSTDALDAAVAATTFGRLSDSESRSGFRERAPLAERFFRRGIVGEGWEALTAGQRERLADSGGDVMDRFRYSHR